jgi:hypothetical protein
LHFVCISVFLDTTDTEEALLLGDFSHSDHLLRQLAFSELGLCGTSAAYRTFGRRGYFISTIIGSNISAIFAFSTHPACLICFLTISYTHSPICFRLAFFNFFLLSQLGTVVGADWFFSHPTADCENSDCHYHISPFPLSAKRKERKKQQKKTRNHFTPGGGIAENKTYPGSSRGGGPGMVLFRLPCREQDRIDEWMGIFSS